MEELLLDYLERVEAAKSVHLWVRSDLLLTVLLRDAGNLKSVKPVNFVVITDGRSVVLAPLHEH